jgi:thymidylate kinase
VSGLSASLKSAVAAHALIVVEGVYGAGKSSLIRVLASRMAGLAVLPDYMFPTEFLDDPALGQAIYPVQDCLKGASARAAIAAQRTSVIIERYMLSTMAHHYAAKDGRFEHMADIFDRLIQFGIIQPPDLTIVVLREHRELLRVDAERGWKTEPDFLERQDFFYSHVVATMTNFITKIEFIENHGDWAAVV